MRIHELLEVLTKKGTASFIINGKTYVLSSVSRDGDSGSRFTLTLRTTSWPYTQIEHTVETTP